MDDTAEMIVPTLSIYLTQLPIFLVWLVGMGLCVVNWRRYPRVAQLTLIALIVIFVETLLNSFLGTWLPVRLIQQGVSMSQVGVILGIWRFVSALIGAVVWGLLLMAIFGWRAAEELPVPVPTQKREGEGAV